MIPVGLILSSIFLSASSVPSTVPLLCKRTRLPGYRIYHLKPAYHISHNSPRMPSCASWVNHFITTAHALLTKLKLPVSRLPTSYSNKDQSERIWPLSLNFLQPGTTGKHRVIAMQTNPIQSSVPELQIRLWHKGRFRILWHLGQGTLMIFVTTEFSLLSRGKERVKMKANAILILDEWVLLRKTVHGVVVMAFCFSER